MTDGWPCYTGRYLSPSISMSPSPFHRYAAELLGTYLLAQAVAMAVTSGAVAPALAAGLTLGVLVYVLGPISGAHLNPAVTIALASLKRISIQDALVYVMAQMLGGAAVLWKFRLLLGNAVDLGASPATVYAAGPLFGELCGAVILLLAVSAVIHKRVEASASGLAIGGALTVGAVSASALSHGILNPAVSLALGELTWLYAIGPVAGGLIGAWVYRWLHERELKTVS